MKKSVLTVGCVAFFLAIGSGIILTKMTKTPPPQKPVVAEAPKMKTRWVLVSSGHIDVGTHLTKENFKWVEWPENLATQLTGAISIRNQNEEKTVENVFRNSVVKTTLENGDFITPVKLFKQGVNNGSVVSYILKTGDRAVTLPLDILNGASGLLQPGDRIDIYLTQALNDPLAGRIIPATGQMMPKFNSEAILKDIKVIAIDKKLSPSKSKDDKVGRTVTLELNQDQVAIINVATKMGSLTDVIRSVSNEGIDDTPKKPYVTTDLQVVPDLRAARLGISPDKLDNEANPFKLINAKDTPKIVDLYRGNENNKQSIKIVDGKLDIQSDNGMVVMRGPKSVSVVNTPDPNAHLNDGSDGSALNTSGALSGQQKQTGLGGAIGGALTNSVGESGNQNEQSNDVPYVPYVSPKYLNSIVGHK